MSSTTIEAIERSIQESKGFVALGDSLERLTNNKDFKKIVIEGYFEKEAVRLVHLKADPNMQSAESQKSIIMQMDAIGALKQYLGLILTQAGMAAKQIESDEAYRDELLEEGN